MAAERSDVVLGAGVTGLAAGWATGLPVYEAAESPGGICASYYVRPDGDVLARAPADGEAYRFEIGGGHWLFGGDPRILARLEQLAPMRRYTRRAEVRLRTGVDATAPYPLQDHLHALDAATRHRVLAELEATAGDGHGERGAREDETMRAWLARTFGPTLCELFFFPFHERYTAGLYDRIAPQDEAKTPVDLARVHAGALAAGSPSGYNQTFAYPEGGLDTLVGAMAAHVDVRYGKRATAIDTDEGEVHFDDGTTVPVGTVYSTLPLDETQRITGVTTVSPPDPATAVVVVNIGAVAGGRCPDAHWVYEPHSTSGFHRVGLYHNVDESFLPASGRGARRVALYVERAWPARALPAGGDMVAYRDAVLDELQAMGYIEDAEVVDTTRVDVAYTWMFPGSRWRAEAIAALRAKDVVALGRYGRWAFQGIADSVAEGLALGSPVGVTQGA